MKKGFDFTLMVAGRKGQAGLGKAGQGASQAELMWLSEERMGEKRDKRQMAVPFLYSGKAWPTCAGLGAEEVGVMPLTVF